MRLLCLLTSPIRPVLPLKTVSTATVTAMISYPLPSPFPRGRACCESARIGEESRNDRCAPGAGVVARRAGQVESVPVGAQGVEQVNSAVAPALGGLCQRAGAVLFGCAEIGKVLGQRFVG